jgi:hypothetical protein
MADASNFVPDEYRRQRGQTMVAAAVDGYVGRTTGMTVPTTHPSDPTGRLGPTMTKTDDSPKSQSTAIEVDPLSVDPEKAAIFVAFVVGGFLLMLSSLTADDWLVVGRFLAVACPSGFMFFVVLPRFWLILMDLRRYRPPVVAEAPILLAGPGVLPMHLPPLRRNV